MRVSVFPAALMALVFAVGPLSPAIPSDEHSTSASEASAISFGARSYATVMAGCRDACFEPTLAVGPSGEMYATSTGNAIVRSLDGGRSWAPVTSPPPPSVFPQGMPRGDQILAVGPGGELHYAALVFQHRGEQGVYAWVPLGIHVATSYDGGSSWDAANHLLSLVGGPNAYGLPADRPWFAIGPSGEIYLSYRAMAPSASFAAAGAMGWAFGEAGVWVSRSSDDGLSWEVPKRAHGGGGGAALRGGPWADHGVTTNGQVVVDQEGNVYVAAFVRDRARSTLGPLPTGDRALVVARSTDGGWSFSTHLVESTGANEPGSYAPSITVGPNGELYIAAKSVDGLVRVFESHDAGETWSGGAVWNAAPAEWGVFALAGPRGLDVLWYEPDGADGAVLQSARAAYPVASSVPERATLSEPLIGVSWSTDAFTDFAFAARLPAGGLAAIWSDADPGDVYVTLEE